ncbi:MAG: hypothetical protein ACHQDB_10625, partial [Steroidobacterales bacterium]
CRGATPARSKRSRSSFSGFAMWTSGQHLFDRARQIDTSSEEALVLKVILIWLSPNGSSPFG